VRISAAPHRRSRLPAAASPGAHAAQLFDESGACRP
jgi:hypothetical protein